VTAQKPRAYVVVSAIWFHGTNTSSSPHKRIDQLQRTREVADEQARRAIREASRVIDLSRSIEQTIQTMETQCRAKTN
jgi:hypothetical protein